MCTVDLTVSVVKSMDLGGRRKGRGETSQRTPQGSLQTCWRLEPSSSEGSKEVIRLWIHTEVSLQDLVVDWTWVEKREEKLI